MCVGKRVEGRGGRGGVDTGDDVCGGGGGGGDEGTSKLHQIP